MLGWYRRIYSSKRVKNLITLLDYISVAIVVLVFAACVALSFVDSVIEGATLVLSAAIPFVLVSIARRYINGKRPYEVYDFLEFTDKKPGRKGGESFPSRHVFSAFLIAGLALPIHVALCVFAAVAGVVLAFCRVSLGIHFIKDAFFGAVIGIISAAIGLLIL